MTFTIRESRTKNHREGNVKEKIAKLPVWARNYIDKLERELDAAKQDIAQMGGQSETDISWGYGHSGMNSGFIPLRETVHFKIDDHYTIDCRIREYAGNRVLDVNASRSLLVYPNATNSVYILKGE